MAAHGRHGDNADGARRLKGFDHGSPDQKKVRGWLIRKRLRKREGVGDPELLQAGAPPHCKLEQPARPVQPKSLVTDFRPARHRYSRC